MTDLTSLISRLRARASLSDEWHAFEYGSKVPSPFLHDEEARLLREAADALEQGHGTAQSQRESES